MPNIFCISLIVSGKGQCRHGLMTSARTSVAKVGPFIKMILSRGRSWWIKTSVSLQAAGRPIPGRCSPLSGVTPKYYCPLSFFPQLRPLRGNSSSRTSGRGALQHLLSMSRVVPSAPATYCVHFLKLCGPERTTGLGGSCQARVQKLVFPFSIMVLRTLCFSNSEAIILKS